MAVMTLTGCPYTEGCDALVDAKPSAASSDAATNGDPDGGSDAATLAPDADLDGAVRPGVPGALIDFGIDPVGGPALSTLS